MDNEGEHVTGGSGPVTKLLWVTTIFGRSAVVERERTLGERLLSLPWRPWRRWVPYTRADPSPWVYDLARESPLSLEDLACYEDRMRGLLKDRHGITDPDVCEKFVRAGVEIASLENRGLGFDHLTGLGDG